MTLIPSHKGSGFHINFANHYELSIQYGRRNYCDNENKLDLEPTETMEVALFSPCGDFTLLRDDVAGYVPVANLAGLIRAVELEDWTGFVTLCGEQTLCPDESPEVQGGWA